jgi:hypothetical protein
MAMTFKAQLIIAMLAAICGAIYASESETESTRRQGKCKKHQEPILRTGQRCKKITHNEANRLARF